MREMRTQGLSEGEHRVSVREMRTQGLSEGNENTGSQ